MSSLAIGFLAFIFVGFCTGVSHDYSGDPFSVSIVLPSHVKLGETVPVQVRITNEANYSLFMEMALMEAVLSEEKAKTACLQPNAKVVENFKFTPKTAGVVNVTLGIGSKSQTNIACDGANQDDSDIIYVSTVNVTVEPEGIKKEQVWSKYACGLDVRERDVFASWNVNTPSEAVEGSVKAFVNVVNNFLAFILNGLDSPLPHGRGDIAGLKDSAAAFLYYKLGVKGEDLQRLSEDFMEGTKRQMQYKLSDSSYATVGDRSRSSSTWMTTYILTMNALKSFDETRQTLDWLNNFQDTGDNEDGCFSYKGRFYHDLLRDETTGKVSRPLFTAYAMIAVGISSFDGPPHLSPFSAKECVVNHVSTRPFHLALKAYALACVQMTEGEDMLKDLFQQAAEDEEFIYWNISDPSEEVQTSSYAAMAIMRFFDRRFESKLDKIMNYLVKKANSQGGFTSVYDTMIAVRTMINYEDHRSKFDVEATLLTEDAEHTLTLNEADRFLTRSVDLTLPTRVNISMKGSGCAFFQGVVQYNVMELYQSNVFSLKVNNGVVSNNVCDKVNRINICVAYLPRTSNLVAVEVTLVSGYIPVEEDLMAIIKASGSLFTDYEVKGNKITFLVDGLSAKETCVDFGVIRDTEVENPRPGMVVVYDYYQPEIARSMIYRIISADLCTNA